MYLEFCGILTLLVEAVEGDDGLVSSSDGKLACRTRTQLHELRLTPPESDRLHCFWGEMNYVCDPLFLCARVLR